MKNILSALNIVSDRVVSDMLQRGCDIVGPQPYMLIMLQMCVHRPRSAAQTNKNRQNKNSCLHQNCPAKRFCQPFYSIYMQHLLTWPYIYICISTLLLPASKNSSAGRLKPGVTSYLGVLRPRLFTFTRHLLRSRAVRTL